MFWTGLTLALLWLVAFALNYFGVWFIHHDAVAQLLLLYGIVYVGVRAFYEARDPY